MGRKLIGRDSWQKQALWLEKITKYMLLGVGGLGVLVIYSGFLFLLLTGGPVANLSWFFFVSPWICIYFGLTEVQQRRVNERFLRRFWQKK